jgi:Ca2+/H+ antiporter, TMEM165/GDT1 family
MKKSFWVKKIIGFLLLAPMAIALFTWIVMLLWNGVLVAVTGVGVVSFWQAMGILVLSKILFGGFRGGSRGGHWKQEMKSKWQNMSDEERIQFKQQWRDRCKTWGRGRSEQKTTSEAGAE